MAEARRPNSRNRRRPKNNSSRREVLKLCTAYLYRKDGCERGELCNNLHICRNYILEHCRAGNSCAFSHDLQSKQTKVLLMRKYGFSLEGETRRKFKSLFAATIKAPRDGAIQESKESQAANKRLNEEKLINFLESFSNIEEKVTSAQSAKVVKKETARRPSENAKSTKATPHTASDPHVSEKVLERPTSEKAAEVPQKKKATQNIVDGSQASGTVSSPTSSSADQEPLVMPSSSEKSLEICCFYIRGSCINSEMRHGVQLHCLQPFQWQIQDARMKDKSWLDLSKQANSHLEEHFCDVNNKEYTGGIHVCGEKTNTTLMHVVTITFGKDSFTIQDGLNQVLDVRRLSTVSFARAGGWRKEYSTQWMWYWKDGTKKWKEYPKQGPVKAGTAASSSINTLTLERKYLDFKFKGKPSCYEFTTDEVQFQIHFSRMEQTCLADHCVFKVARRPKYSTLEHPAKSTQSVDDVKEPWASNFSADKQSDELNPAAAPKKVSNDAASAEDVEETKSPKEEKQPREEKTEELGPIVACSSASQSVKPKAVGYKTTPCDVTSFKGSEGTCAYQPKGAGNPIHLQKEPEASVFVFEKPDGAMPKEGTGRALPSRDTDKLSENVFRGSHPSRVQDAVRPKERTNDQQLQVAKPKLDALNFAQLEAFLDSMKDGGTLSPENTAEVQVFLKTFVASGIQDGTWTCLPYSLMSKIIAARSLYVEQHPDTSKPKEVCGSQLEEEPTFSVLSLNEASAKSVSQKSRLSSPRSPSMPVAAACSSPTDVASQRTGYQTESAMYICTYFLRGRCFDEDKYNHKRHYRQPYQWQFKDPRQTNWQDLPKSENCNCEKIFCDVNRSLYNSRSDSNFYSDTTIRFDISPMTGSVGQYHVNVRRLSTVSSVTKSNWEKVFCIEWVWYWLDETQRWIVYSEQNMKGIKAGIDSSSIEQKYLDYESKMGAAKIKFTAGGQQYELDFQTMQQKNIHHHTCRRVRRRPKFVEMAERKQESKRRKTQAQVGSVPVPATWENPGAQADKVLVNIRNFSSAEYVNIANLFWDTMDDKATIVSIQRVQNLELWEDFTRMNARMKKRKNGQPVLQKQLFHGTQEKYTEAISRQNFDWRLSGTTVGTLYGKGSYFARDASFSNSYTAPDSDDCRYVFVAQVLIGDTTTGIPSYVRPPPKDPNNPHGELYDACVNDLANPEIFVVFEKTQVYPEYLIRYKLKSAASAGYTRSQSSAHTTSAYPRSNPSQNYTNPNPAHATSGFSYQTHSVSSHSYPNYTSSARPNPPPRTPTPTKKNSSCTVQ